MERAGEKRRKRVWRQCQTLEENKGMERKRKKLGKDEKIL